MLSEENHVELINSYTREDWQPLLELIPQIEKTLSFGEWISGKDKNGFNQTPYCNPAPIVCQFEGIILRIPVMIVFDWGSWLQGSTMLSDKDFDFDSIDLVAKCKLITAIVRSDRFCEGALVGAFESGLILRILKSIERQTMPV